MSKLSRHSDGALFQHELDELTKEQILDLINEAEYITREDVLGLFVSAHWSHMRQNGQSAPVLPHTFEYARESVKDLPGMQHSILRVQDELQPNHADRMITRGQALEDTPSDSRLE